MTTNADLADFMRQHDLSRLDVARLLELATWKDPRRPGTIRCPAVDAWLAPIGTARHRAMPAHRLRLLRMLVAAGRGDLA